MTTDRAQKEEPLPPSLAEAVWSNSPPNWSVEENGTLRARSGADTDFWRTTHYGFVRDDGHALLTPRSGEFTATLTFDGDYQTLYDQAGLMVRSGPQSWIKFGVELTDGLPHLSCVVTHGISDWSARPMPEASDRPVTIRVTRIGDALLLQSREGEADRNGAGQSWRMERLAPWPREPIAVGIGPYLCSPQREGFEARFLDFDADKPAVRALHD